MCLSFSGAQTRQNIAARNGFIAPAHQRTHMTIANYILHSPLARAHARMSRGVLPARISRLRSKTTHALAGQSDTKSADPRAADRMGFIRICIYSRCRAVYLAAGRPVGRPSADVTAYTRLSDTHADARTRTPMALARMRVRVWKITRIMDFPACKTLDDDARQRC